MSAHSPAPWKIVETTDPKIISSWSIQVGDQSISFFPYVYQYADEEKTCGGYVSSPERHANARLIAAAPEMLDALRKAVVLLAGACVHSPELEPHETYEAVSAAIAKATGATP